jgi:cell fate regulator YaaT (PSP1 superfamily)
MSDGPRPHVGVKFTRVGRVHSCQPPDQDLDPPLAQGEDVVVRTATGLARATVACPVPAMAARRSEAVEVSIVRRPTSDDDASHVKLRDRERDARQFCLLKIRERSLEMKLTGVEQLPDGSRLVFYFTAESRVDFRELVRDLAAEYRTRIEMRQIGVRDEARVLGGYGSCGRPLCCTTWLQSFEPVSIKMAKTQKLSLNPTKLSGLCGRLKCCLRYELGDGAGAARGRDESHGGCGSEGGCGGGGCGCGRRPGD